MEQDVPILENSPRTHSSEGHARSFRVSHWALSSTHLTTQKMDSMTTVFQSLDSQTFKFVRSRVSWPVLFLGSMLGAVRVPSLLMHSCLFLVYIFIYFYWSKCLFIAYLMYSESNFLYIHIYIYIYIHISYSFFFFSLVWFLIFMSLLHCHFVTKNKENWIT